MDAPPQYKPMLEAQPSARRTIRGPELTAQRARARTPTPSGVVPWLFAEINGLKPLTNRLLTERLPEFEPQKAEELWVASVIVAPALSRRTLTTMSMPEKTAMSTKRTPAAIGPNMAAAAGPVSPRPPHHTPRPLRDRSNRRYLKRAQQRNRLLRKQGPRV